MQTDRFLRIVVGGGLAGTILIVSAILGNSYLNKSAYRDEDISLKAISTNAIANAKSQSEQFKFDKALVSLNVIAEQVAQHPTLLPPIEDARISVVEAQQDFQRKVARGWSVYDGKLLSRKDIAQQKRDIAKQKEDAADLVFGKDITNMITRHEFVAAAKAVVSFSKRGTSESMSAFILHKKLLDCVAAVRRPGLREASTEAVAATLQELHRIAQVLRDMRIDDTVEQNNFTKTLDDQVVRALQTITFTLSVCKSSFERQWYSSTVDALCGARC